MGEAETIHGDEGYTIHLELKDFEDVLELVTSIHATIVHRFCEGADCDKCKKASEKGLCKSVSCAAAILDFLRSESNRRGNV